MNDLVTQPSGAVTVSAPSSYRMQPRNIDEAWQLAEMMAQSELVPKDFKGKPGNIIIAMQWGAEVGMAPLQAIQGIAIINGRPSMWGDALMALVRGSSVCEYILEEEIDGTAYCRVKRRGEQEQVRTFSQADAKKAGLDGKSGPWSQYPSRMKQMRARAFALRDVFADVLKGMQVVEEVRDYEPAPASAPNRPAPQVVTASEELIERAKANAEDGVEAYAAFWSGITKEERRALAFKHDEFKALAQEKDAPAGESAEPEPEPAADLDPFVAAMDRAEASK